MTIQSAKNPYNVYGLSGGVDYDGFKVGGERALECGSRFGACDYSIDQMRSPAPFGAMQGQQGSLFGDGYPPNGFSDRLIEYYSGPHDWFSQGFYNDGGNLIPVQNLATDIANTGVSFANLFVSTPFAASHFATNNMQALNPVISNVQ